MSFFLWWPRVVAKNGNGRVHEPTHVPLRLFDSDELERQRQLHLRLDRVENVLVSLRGERRSRERSQ